MRRIVCGCFTLLAFCVATARAQRPFFEVVSLKLGDLNERRKGIGVRGNQFEVVNFPFTLRYMPELTQAAGDPNPPSVFTALEEQLGLKLEFTRGPVEVLVIDNAKKGPA